MITHVLFDLGGVLLSKGLSAFVEEAAAGMGLAPRELEAKMKVHEGPLRQGKLPFDEYWRLTFPLHPPSENLLKRWFDSYILREDVLGFALSLKPRYAIGIQSNNFRERFEYLDRKFSLSGRFPLLFLSYMIGEKKPDAAFYRAIQERLDCPPENVLIVDDKERNLESARSLGLETFFFASVSGLSTFLSAATSPR